MDELEIVDAQNRPLGFTKPKPEAHRDGDWHRTSEIVVLNERQEILLSLRHPDKVVLPNYWDVCVGGHVEPGETYEECAIREVEEEIGVRPRAEELHFLGTVAVEAIDETVGLQDREHAGVYLFRTSRTLDQFRMQIDEVADLCFRPLAIVKQEILDPDAPFRYTPPHGSYLRTLQLTEAHLQTMADPSSSTDL